MSTTITTHTHTHTKYQTLVDTKGHNHERWTGTINHTVDHEFDCSVPMLVTTQKYWPMGNQHLFRTMSPIQYIYIYGIWAIAHTIKHSHTPINQSCRRPQTIKLTNPFKQKHSCFIGKSIDRSHTISDDPQGFLLSFLFTLLFSVAHHAIFFLLLLLLVLHCIASHHTHTNATGLIISTFGTVSHSCVRSFVFNF